jgi:hypothetical protein
MSSSRFLTLALAAALGCAMARVEAAPPNKCVVNGTVTYQQGPGASGQIRKQPTLEELNAAEKQRRAAALLNCPGVKMDGDHDGVPCEKQWCAR